MDVLFSNFKKQTAINKLLFSLLIFVLILVFYLYVIVKISNKYVLTEQVATHLQNRLIEAGVPPQIPIGREIIHADTMLLRFYVDRAFRPAWMNKKGPVSLADSLVKSIRFAHHEGLRPEHYHIQEIEAMLDSVRRAKKEKKPFDIQRLSDLDLLLTDAFLLYGSHLLSGHVDPETIDPEWITKFPETDMTDVLTGALNVKKIQYTLSGLLPSFSYYRRLRDELGRYRSIAWRGGWPIVPEGPTLQKGDQGYRVAALRARLMVSGDYVAESLEENAKYDSTLEQAVLRFQRRHNLDEDGAIGYRTRLAMNVPALHYVRKLSANMERWRWLPRDLGNRYILVNIAAFELLAVEAGETVLKMRVVVGKDFRQTPVFSGTMIHLVLNPYWNVPSTIANEDILPEVKKDTGYLKSRDIEVFADWSSKIPLDPDSIDWASITPENMPYRFRQAPGKKNALGRMKFLFPNKYEVYLHDTPYRIHFAKRERAYSSGCIRLEDPLALAEYVLRGNPNWSREKIEAALENVNSQSIQLLEPIPVYIFYCTAWLDEDGTIHYLKDIYDRDAILENAMRQEAFLPY